MEAAGGCRDALKTTIEGLATRIQSSTCCLILSGGVDTAAILEANSELEKDKTLIFNHAITVLASTSASDRPYSALVAKRHNLEEKHHILDVSLDDLLCMIPFCVRVLQSFDGMTLRNCIVVALAMHKAKDLGVTHVITGDGADELLGGYSFTWNTDDPLWTEKRNTLANTMHFSTPAMAQALGLTSASPYLEPSFITWVVDKTTKSDCILLDALIELTPTSERQVHITGKGCLRYAFPDSGAAWRRKDPIEVGSGATGLTNHFTQRMSPEEFTRQVQEIQTRDQVVIRDPEHLFYYQAFREEFPAGLPGVARFASDPCGRCGYELRSVTENFCYVCGAWPAREVVAPRA